jgi:broad specificity phosphatase PhoE
MNIYFIRHGESIANRECIHQGATYDTNLSPLGIEQARKLYRSQVLPKNPTKVFSSPLLRARQTAMYALGYTDENQANISFDERIVERDGGIFNGLRKEEVYTLLPNLRLDDRFDHPSTESKELFLARLEDYLSNLLNSIKEGDHVLIFAHGGVNKNAAKLLTEKFYVTNGRNDQLDGVLFWAIIIV